MRKTLAIGTLLSLIALIAGTVSAENPGNPTILAAVTALANQLTNITNQLTQLTGGTNTTTQLYTPMLTASNVGEGRNLECRVVNVSSAPVTVTAALIKDDGTVADSSTCTFDPGEEGCAAFGSCFAPDFVCRAYCRFTGATNQQIRGSIILTPQTTGNALAALAAQ